MACFWQLRTSVENFQVAVIGNAAFVPPPPEEMTECSNALEKFLHRQKEDLPILVKAALVHVQYQLPLPNRRILIDEVFLWYRLRYTITANPESKSLPTLIVGIISRYLPRTGANQIGPQKPSHWQVPIWLDGPTTQEHDLASGRRQSF